MSLLNKPIVTQKFKNFYRNVKNNNWQIGTNLRVLELVYNNQCNCAPKQRRLQKFVYGFLYWAAYRQPYFYLFDYFENKTTLLDRFKHDNSYPSLAPDIIELPVNPQFELGLKQVNRYSEIIEKRKDIAEHYGVSLTRESRAEQHLRTMEQRLERIIELDPSPLTIPRTPKEKQVGVCRDFVVFLTSLLRHNKIPARMRVGFAMGNRLRSSPVDGSMQIVPAETPCSVSG